MRCLRPCASRLSLDGGVQASQAGAGANLDRLSEELFRQLAAGESLSVPVPQAAGDSPCTMRLNAACMTHAKHDSPTMPCARLEPPQDLAAMVQF